MDTLYMVITFLMEKGKTKQTKNWRVEGGRPKMDITKTAGRKYPSPAMKGLNE